MSHKILGHFNIATNKNVPGVKITELETWYYKQQMIRGVFRVTS